MRGTLLDIIDYYHHGSINNCNIKLVNDEVHWGLVDSTLHKLQNYCMYFVL